MRRAEAVSEALDVIRRAEKVADRTGHPQAIIRLHGKLAHHRHHLRQQGVLEIVHPVRCREMK